MSRYSELLAALGLEVYGGRDAPYVGVCTPGGLGRRDETEQGVERIRKGLRA